MELSGIMKDTIMHLHYMCIFRFISVHVVRCSTCTCSTCVHCLGILYWPFYGIKFV